MKMLSPTGGEISPESCPRFLAPAPRSGTTGFEETERKDRAAQTLELLEAWAWIGGKPPVLQHAIIVVSDPRWLGHPLLDDFCALAERGGLRQNNQTAYSGPYGSSPKPSASLIRLSYTQPRPSDKNAAHTGEILLSSPAMPYTLSRMRAMLELYGLTPRKT